MLIFARIFRGLPAIWRFTGAETGTIVFSYKFDLRSL